MSQVPYGLTQEQAVRKAIEEPVGNTTAGYKSSGKELLKRANFFYFGGSRHDQSIAIQTVYNVRKQWERERGIVSDARTHASIDRRNMLADNQASVPLIVELDTFIKDQRQLTAPRFAAFLERASQKGLHSLDQLKEISTHLNTFRQEARRAA